MSSSRINAAAIVKPYLKKFVLKTHPDFFAKAPSQAQVNAKSLQQLYTVLDPILKSSNVSRTPESSRRKGQPLRLTFHSKTNPRQSFTGTFQENATTGSPWATVQAFLKLCQQADIQVPASDIDAVRQMLAKQQATAKKKNKPAKSLTQEFAEALHKHYYYHTGPSIQKTSWTPDEILQNRLLMFGPTVNRDDWALRLSHWLPHLEPGKWWGILPTLVLPSHSDEIPSELARGMLVLTGDMQLPGEHISIKRK